MPVAFEISPSAPNSVIANPLAMSPDGGSVAFVGQAAGGGRLSVDRPHRFACFRTGNDAVRQRSGGALSDRLMGGRSMLSEGRLQRMPVSGGAR